MHTLRFGSPRPPAGKVAAPGAVALPVSSPQQRERSRSFVAKYRDPAGYEELFKDRLRMLRPTYADLGRTLGLKDEEAEQLTELLVRQELASEEAASKCIAEP